MRKDRDAIVGFAANCSMGSHATADAGSAASGQPQAGSSAFQEVPSSAGQNRNRAQTWRQFSAGACTGHSNALPEVQLGLPALSRADATFQMQPQTPALPQLDIQLASLVQSRRLRALEMENAQLRDALRNLARLLETTKQQNEELARQLIGQLNSQISVHKRAKTSKAAGNSAAVSVLPQMADRDPVLFSRPGATACQHTDTRNAGAFALRLSQGRDQGR